MIPCEVIRDLLPLYIDDACSEKTTEYMKEHLESCADCKMKYNGMKENVLSNTVISTEHLNEIKPLSLVKRYIRRKMILISSVAVILLLVVLMLLIQNIQGKNNEITFTVSSDYMNDVVTEIKANLEEKWSVGDKLIIQLYGSDDSATLLLGGHGHYLFYLNDILNEYRYQVIIDYDNNLKTTNVSVKQLKLDTSLWQGGVQWNTFVDCINDMGYLGHKILLSCTIELSCFPGREIKISNYGNSYAYIDGNLQIVDGTSSLPEASGCVNIYNAIDNIDESKDTDSYTVNLSDESIDLCNIYITK